jgi:hypothetical protein
MIAIRHHFRLPLVALAAIVGMLSAVGEVSACTATRRAAGACCDGRDRSACCCEAGKAGPQPRSADGARTHSPSGGGLRAPDASCQCRSGGPTDPAPKPRSPSSERRTDPDRIRSVGPVTHVRPTTALVRLIPPTESPPGNPLYLRTSRLLT